MGSSTNPRAQKSLSDAVLGWAGGVKDRWNQMTADPSGYWANALEQDVIGTPEEWASPDRSAINEKMMNLGMAGLTAIPKAGKFKFPKTPRAKSPKANVAAHSAAVLSDERFEKSTCAGSLEPEL